jgi:large subunit ribosomal protein L12e
MPPKVDPTEIRYVKLKCIGGELAPSAALAPKIGPLGLSPKKIGEDILKATGDWKGIKVVVELKIQNRVAEVILIHSASALILKELNEPVRDRKKVKNVKHSGNLTFTQIRKIAEVMYPRSCARTFKGVIKEILGTCVSVGCKVEGRTPKEVLKMVNNDELDVSEP